MAQTVLIVDDESGFRLIARELLELGGFDVLGEAGSGAEAIAAARDLRPDLVLLDVQLPDTDGFAVARLLTQAGDGPRVVLCSVRAAPRPACPPRWARTASTRRSLSGSRRAGRKSIATTSGSMTQPPRRNTPHRVDEFGGAGDPILEQVADRDTAAT